MIQIPTISVTPVDGYPHRVRVCVDLSCYICAYHDESVSYSEFSIIKEQIRYEIFRQGPYYFFDGMKLAYRDKSFSEAKLKALAKAPAFKNVW